MTKASLPSRRLGPNGLQVSAIGFGCMSLGIAEVYSSSVRDDHSANELINYALNLEITFLDTANIYGDSELKLGQALRGRRKGVVIASKFGFVQNRIGSDERIDGTPKNVRASCDLSLARLGVDTIDLYYLHRVDTHVPIEETVGAMAELVKAGKVRHLGICEASAATIRRAHAVHPIAAVQSEYSLWSREPEDEVLPVLDELGIGFVAYSPLGRGFLAGRFRTLEDLAPDDWRRGSPRFQGENFQRNLALVDRVNEMAREKNCTAAQLALAWVLARGPNIVPIPGTSSGKRLKENVGALDVNLSQNELERLEEIAPKGVAVGDRYAPAGMTLVGH